MPLPRAAPPRNRIQETAISVQFVPAMRFLVFNFRVYGTRTQSSQLRQYAPTRLGYAVGRCCAMTIQETIQETAFLVQETAFLTRNRIPGTRNRIPGTRKCTELAVSCTVLAAGPRVLLGAERDPPSGRRRRGTPSYGLAPYPSILAYARYRATAFVV
eukprot:2571058-Rhodomonas_salina.2